MTSRQWLSKIFAQIPRIFLPTMLISTLGTCGQARQSVYASDQKVPIGNVIEPLQTQISQRDMEIIECLVEIAQRNSPQVREVRTGMGLSGFNDIVSIEIASYLTNRKYISSTPSSEDEDGISATITIDPIKLVNISKRQGIAKARWQEAKKQKRVAVVQYYLAYVQARQTAKIATHKMKKMIGSVTVANISSQEILSAKVNHLDNPDYVAVATELLNANTHERIALEELAACVGLSPEEAIAIFNRHLQKLSNSCCN
jgi:hypothetical protein